MIPPMTVEIAFLIKNSVVKFLSVKNSTITEIRKVVITKNKVNFNTRFII